MNAWPVDRHSGSLVRFVGLSGGSVDGGRAEWGQAMTVRNRAAAWVSAGARIRVGSERDAVEEPEC